MNNSETVQHSGGKWRKDVRNEKMTSHWSVRMWNDKQLSNEENADYNQSKVHIMV